MAKSWLSYANLSDEYERKARFLPAVLSILPLLPASAALGGPIEHWLEVSLMGLGIGAVASVGLSHAASAMGNRLQKRLWPRWPHDSPTNRWLHPDDEATSMQQKQLWYSAAKRLVAIDIAAAVAEGEEIEATINDAISALRSRFWNRPEAERLRMHNIDYGFARNLTGMRLLWMGSSITSALVCWIEYFVGDAVAPSSAFIATLMTIVFIPLAFWTLPEYVRTKATYYAESFFGTLSAVDRTEGIDLID